MEVSPQAAEGLFRSHAALCVWGHACQTFLLECFAFDHACCLPHSAKKKDSLRDVTFLFRAGRNRHLERSQMSCGYQALLVHFGLVRFLQAIPTELRNRRRSVSTLLRSPIGIAMLSAGSTLGLRAPDCAKETLSPWTLFM